MAWHSREATGPDPGGDKSPLHVDVPLLEDAISGPDPGTVVYWFYLYRPGKRRDQRTYLHAPALNTGLEGGNCFSSTLDVPTEEAFHIAFHHLVINENSVPVFDRSMAFFHNVMQTTDLSRDRHGIRC